MDNVLIDHYGERIEDVGYFWDHAEERYKIAHDYVIADYVCTSGKHYPLEFRRFLQRERCEERGLEFRDHNVQFREPVDWTIRGKIPGYYAFDSWFTHAKNLNHINARDRGYVGDLKFNRKSSFKARTSSPRNSANGSGPKIVNLSSLMARSNGISQRPFEFLKSIVAYV